MTDTMRLRELVGRLVASGPKCSAVSASECHEIAEGVLELLDERVHRKTLTVDAQARLDAKVREYSDARLVQLREQLAAMTAARDRTYQIAKGTFALHLMTPELAAELDRLSKVGAP